ncbi:MAG: GNAT family N-acetyltransferase [Candidatus Thorarchaeota archaeon]|nr:GNAT family N-acetyltransferase [Candidatus Thorarchaeota archaeon]
MTITIRPTQEEDCDWVTGILIDNWASNIVVTRGISYEADRLPGLIAEIGGKPVGLLTYSIKKSELEIITMNALEKGKGVGTALIDEVEKIAKRNECHRIWLITTNDNIDAIRFYQRRGFEIAKVHRYAIEESRKLKPQLPSVGKYGIPIRDEIEMERNLEE